jgi:hypothetical protein
MSVSAVKLNDVRSTNNANLALLFANVAGAVLYLLLASRGWRIESEHGVIPISGEPFVWALALPVLGVFLILNFVWAVILLRRREGWRTALWWISSASIWFLAVVADFAHH